MGLLDSMEQAPQQPQGGLLGGMMAEGAAPAPQGGQSLQMAMQLAQNPSMEMAQQIIAQLKQAGSPEADQLEQILQQTGGDPAKIKQIADAAVQHLGQQ